MNHEAEQAPQADWDQTTLSVLIQHILDTHHAYLREALPRLTQLAQASNSAEGGKDAAGVCGVLEGLRAEIESHMWKEEMVLFPLIRSLEEAEASGKPAPPSHCGSVRNPIRVMEQEHEAAKGALEELKKRTVNYTDPAAAGVSAAMVQELRRLDEDLRHHIHLEDDILFPRAIELEARLAV
ncbi:MAG: hemerythrin domain-containing protein [Bryobacteraceae bacterium]|nr:hemerythrin domain-containing protein [Bryobacteraceae bacterium]